MINILMEKEQFLSEEGINLFIENLKTLDEAPASGVGYVQTLENDDSIIFQLSSDQPEAVVNGAVNGILGIIIEMDGDEIFEPDFNIEYFLVDDDLNPVFIGTFIRENEYDDEEFDGCGCPPGICLAEEPENVPLPFIPALFPSYYLN